MRSITMPAASTGMLRTASTTAAAAPFLLSSLAVATLNVLLPSSLSYSSSSSSFFPTLIHFASAAPKVDNLDFPCTEGWTGPSSDNSFECSSDSIMEFIGKSEVWGTFVPFVLGFLILIPTCCVVLIGRYCCNCCGSNKMRPSSFCGGKCCGKLGDDPDDLIPVAEHVTKNYSRWSILTVRGLSVVLLLTAAIIGFVLSYVGGTKVAQGISDLPSTIDNVADWAIGIITDVKQSIATPNIEPPEYPNGFDATMFDTATNDIDSYKKDIKDLIEEYMDIIQLVIQIVSYISIVPAAVLLMPGIAAIFGIRRYLPMIYTLTAFVFQFIWFLFSTICLLLVLVFTLVYSDVTTTESSQRSLTQWYLVPTCDSEGPFLDAKANMEAMESDSSTDACTELLKVCSTATIYDPITSPDVVFHCELSAGSDCTTVEDVEAAVDSMYVMTGVPQTKACGAAIDNADCTFERCADDCEIPEVKLAANDAVTALDTAKRVLQTLDDKLMPWMNCNALIQKVVSLGLSDGLKKLQDGFDILSVGSLFLAVGLVVGIVLALMGQKRYVSQSASASVFYGSMSGGVDGDVELKV